MFERYITDALTTHFGHIVESVDADKMQLSAWKGEFELHDVSLKSDALDNILKQECPVEIAFGYIGTFQVKIPWSLLSAQFLSWQQDNNSEPRLLESSACSIVLSDVNILITPKRKTTERTTKSTEDEPSKEEEDADTASRRRIEKEREVQSLLDANLLKRVTESSVSSARWNWLQNWISSVLSTLSVTVRNIHIRYEDPGTSMGFQWRLNNNEEPHYNRSSPVRPLLRQQRYRPSFAVGITLKEFSVQSVAKSSAQKATTGSITTRIDARANVDLEEKEWAIKDAEGDATTVSSQSGSTLERSAGDDVEKKDGKPSRVPFVERYKLAAAEHLAVYWDSDSILICEKVRQQRANKSTEPLQKTDFPALYRELFAILNDGEDSQLPDFGHVSDLLREEWHRNHHSYLLKPISPSVHLTLVSEKMSDDGSPVQDEGYNVQQSKRTTHHNTQQKSPPSSIQIDLPPCKFTFARSTLEDSVYLRKSHSVWTDANKTLLSEETLYRLAKLRPVQSPLDDPRKWWRYAFEATKTLSRVEQLSRGGRHRKTGRTISTDDLDRPLPLTRRKGWFGLVQAVSRRRKYVRLYELFIAAAKSKDISSETKAHHGLLVMEDELLPEEIVSFRMHVYEMFSSQSELLPQGENDGGSESYASTLVDDEQPGLDDGSDILSVRHRHWMMNDMKQALDRERANKENQIAEHDQVLFEDPTSGGKLNPVIWSSSLVCPELAIQINDHISDPTHDVKQKSSTPVVRMSSAIVQNQSWNEDGSWVSTWSIASLEVKDLISLRGQGSSTSHFARLLGKKSIPGSVTDEYIVINGIRYDRSINVTVNKQLHWPNSGQQPQGENPDRGSTTTTLVRVLPMEIVYSTFPVEAVTRVLATVKTPEIVDDYHKVLAAANSWREEQKRKLIDALAHKNKKIIVDIDVGAPELLIPEDIHRFDSPMLTIDFGRIQAYNDDDALNGGNRDAFDDQWRVRVSNMKIQSTIVSSYFLATRTGHQVGDTQHTQHLVEAFSIDFAVSTKIQSEGSGTSGAESKIHISATLPRLDFNVSSSAIHLTSRLQEHWRHRKKETQRYELRAAPVSSKLYPSGPAKTSKQSDANSQKPKKHEENDKSMASRELLFEFSAPLITLKLENDRKKVGAISTPLFDLALGGISGRFWQTVDQKGSSSTRFNASLQSLGVIDLFQSAGKDYVLLMSSVPQVALIDSITHGQTYSWDSIRANYDLQETGEKRNALVRLEFLNEVKMHQDASGRTITEHSPTKISIWFHELYVEWNPETLAAIQQAVAIPTDVDMEKKFSPTRQSFPDEGSWDSADEFFDAMEELDDGGSENSGNHSLSEISSSSEPLALPESSSSPPRAQINRGFLGEGLSSPARLSLSSVPGSPFASGLSYFDAGPLCSLSNLETVEDPTTKKTVQIVFELAKLRVSFNKETRHRKLMIAQMDRTSVSYATKPTGGSLTSLRIGNLVFSDPVHEKKGTLYGHILGLKNDVTGESDNNSSSLLEMDIVLNSSPRQFSSILNGAVADSVTIDRHQGAMTGSDCCVTARLSPMRFVMIQQLWLEIIDYFFQGVIGSNVIGSGKTDRTSQRDILRTYPACNSVFLLGSDAIGISFTKFHITLESPVILLPVTYASPEFIRLELSKIVLANLFTGEKICDNASGVDRETAERMQWYNNCEVSLEALRLFSWSGLELGKESTSANVKLRWPTGPLAHLILPKWNVLCTFDDLDISSRRSDFALLQNIISYNIGEASRYMDEWTALQNLSDSALHSYMENIIIHYGYDKKDVAPSTYQMSIIIASLKFSLVDGRRTASPPIATARCLDLRFDMSKGADLVVRQKLCCDIDLVSPDENTSDPAKLLSMSKYDSLIGEVDTSTDEERPGLTYSSVTTNQNSVKSIEIVEACIYMLIPKWRQFTAFFQSLPPPILLNEHDIGASIQVGDRWYKIGDGASSPLATSHPSANKVGKERFSWINNGASSTSINFAQSRRLSQASKLDMNHSPASQMRILLIWPRIVMASKATEGPTTRVTLRMNHLEYLQTNTGPTFSLSKSLFLHNVEVYTSSELHTTDLSESQEDNSLIRPWSVALAVSTCNGERIGICDTHEYKLSADVLRARAAYSDMAIALDVALSALYSAKDEVERGIDELALEPVFTAGSYDTLDTSVVEEVGDGEVDEDSFCLAPVILVYDLQCDGFQLQVADDSGRHFAGSQDLVVFSLGEILFSRRDHSHGVIEMKLSLKSLDLIDCLQPINSRFRMAASSPSQSASLVCRSIERKMNWELFGLQPKDEYYYEASGDFLLRLKGSSDDCTMRFWDVRETTLVDGLFEIDSKSYSQNHALNVKVRSLQVQWNPSTVIAVQRFLGRLRKESRLIALQLNDIIGKKESVQPHERLDPRDPDSVTKSTLSAQISVESLKMCLNKEHQYRRLLELTITDCNARLCTSAGGIAIEASIGDLLALDTDEYSVGIAEKMNIADNVRTVLSVVDLLEEGGHNAFLRVTYQQFTPETTLESRADIPEWAKIQAKSPDEVDDVLSVSIATTRFTYLKERTEEMLDYLSNGLPGKGMGVTSRAAKGFISRRIQSRSFLQIRIVSPQVYIPQHELVMEGLVFHLGDVALTSWFEESTSIIDGNGPLEWWRLLSLKLSGFYSGFTRIGPECTSLTSATKPIDLNVVLRKPTVSGKPMSVTGKLSSFVTCLAYSDYALLRALLRDNVGRQLDKEKWDNIEKAYWMESGAENEDGTVKRMDDVGQTVHYASDARFVRYGKAGKKGNKSSKDIPDESSRIGTESKPSYDKTFDLRFDLAGLSLELRRDDLVAGISLNDEISSAFHYNVMLLRVEAVEILTSSNSNGDSSFNFSLFRLGLFDLGDEGRLARERYYFSLPDDELGRLNMKRRLLREPCPFHVLVEGYGATTDDFDLSSSTMTGPQFVASFDTCPASSTTGFGSLSESGLPPDSKVTVARIVINHLSVNALVRPYQEIVEFLTVKWDSEGKEKPSFLELRKIPDPITPVEEGAVVASGRGLELKLVAHYPKIFFLADESDSHSRALVLRGLAVINVSDVLKVETVGSSDPDSVDSHHITIVDAQLHGLETYINPDVNAALRFSQRHAEMIGRDSSSQIPMVYESNVLNSSDLLGVALIQPVTTGIELTQLKRELFPTRRSLVVNIEPVSTMLSFEDLQLVEVVLNRLSRSSANKGDVNHDCSTPASEAKSFESSNEQYIVEFQESKLGLGLKTEDNKIIVSSVQEYRHAQQIHSGDQLLSVNGDSVIDKSLRDVVGMLGAAKRPVLILFERSTPQNAAAPSRNGHKSPGKQLKSYPQPTEETERVSESFHCIVYSLQFHLGRSLGLELEESSCGKFPVVSKILPSIDEAVVVANSIDASHSEQIEIVGPGFDAGNKRVPKVGAVVVAIDDIPIDEIGVVEAWRLLAQARQSLEGGNLGSGATFQLTFQEVPSDLWGRIDIADLSLAGISLSFIDDLNGRDMPIFRAKLSMVEFHAEQGVGVEAHIIDSSVPSLLSPLEGVSIDDSVVTLASDAVRDMRSESIVSLSAVGKFAIEYFHPKVSYWEPLLESSQIFFLLEKQEGSKESGRPTQVALELSDRIPKNHFVRANLTQSIYFSESSMIPVNITDAAADVLFRSIGQWNKWRKELAAARKDEQSLEVEGYLNPKSEGASDLHTSHKSSADLIPTVTNTTGAQNVAAQKAAQAALNFAKKRGAETSKHQDSSKPFILRNRMGICIAFVQQGRGIRDQGYARRRTSGSRRSMETTIGDYNGLEQYQKAAITELADNEDAKFDMHVIVGESQDNANSRQSVRLLGNKVRSYEGRYPNLTIAAQAVFGVVIEPMKDLQVFKVGSTSFDLLMKKEQGDAGPTTHSFRVIWDVQIEDNRRILTLSSAARISSSFLSIPIEIGMRSCRSPSDKEIILSAAAISSIGVARSQDTFFMPLWLALRLEPFEVFVRPVSNDGREFHWSEYGILRFQSAASNSGNTKASTIQRWVWKQPDFNHSSVQCVAVDPSHQDSVWFSVFKSSHLCGNYFQFENPGNTVEASGRRNETEPIELLSLTLDTCFTIRNMLPVEIAYEISRCSHISEGLPSIRLDSLQSGECSEVSEVHHGLSDLRARFRQCDGAFWSTWASLKLDEIDDVYDDAAESSESPLLRSTQVNVEIPDESLGTPLTFGVRIVPKTTTDDPTSALCYGLEVIVYAEIWIRNITSLPLNFGCPSHQLHKKSPNPSSDESAAKFTAEFALLELASLLEGGDKGTGLNQTNAREIEESGRIESLPQQEAPFLVEEVFEYVEIDGSVVRRRWWASDSFDSYRPNITEADDDFAKWKWLDNNWAIDVAGDAKPSIEGWESCRNLLTGEGSFSGFRTFNPTHVFRRRRYFRTRSGIGRYGSTNARNDILRQGDAKSKTSCNHFGSIQVYHQPLNDSFSRELYATQKRGNKARYTDGNALEGNASDTPLKLALKCGDGTWSSTITIPMAGTSYGIVKVLSTRWPSLATSHSCKFRGNVIVKKTTNQHREKRKDIDFKCGSLTLDLFELCYVISDAEGEWGDFSRTVEVSPRFVVRNDSSTWCLRIKQAGAPDVSSLNLKPGQASAFYWADYHLPRLVCVQPYGTSDIDGGSSKWSGGFDLCNLGMTPIRIRHEGSGTSSLVNSIRSLVEVRPGTGGMGINVSLKEENEQGEGSLFRIENLTPFPIWLEQDGMLANPTARMQAKARPGDAPFGPPIDGDVIAPHSKSTFALDVPYRQGKYSSRKEATLSELLHVRVALAPLSSRYGVEMVKVVGLTDVGETIRFNPSRLPLTLPNEVWEKLRSIRVLGVVASDGPTRVLKFCLMQYTGGDDVFTKNFGEIAYYSQTSSNEKDSITSSDTNEVTMMISLGAEKAVEQSMSESLPNEVDAKRNALFSNYSSGMIPVAKNNDTMDTIFSVRAEFSGFVFSLVDAAPSEIAVASCRNFNALTRWNKLRTADASVLLSVGWLQVDNHVPSAPFKVAVRPDTSIRQRHNQEHNLGGESSGPTPLLVIAMAFAPKHKSKIMVLRSVTVAPKDLIIALDLAFLVRMQRFLMGLHEHAQKTRTQTSTGQGVTSFPVNEKIRIEPPSYLSPEEQLEIIASFSENQKLYFQGLTILPTNIRLSVAPARALTAEQANLEGEETAAIHEAVRKGDVLVGNSTRGPLGVRVGKKNKTPVAVVRGMFKSIVVDAILRLDGASLNFPGVFLRNHIATGSQLTTLLVAHYVSSLKSNVPALLGSLAAIGNPIGLIRGIGDGVSDFVTEPVKGFKRSLKELDPGYVVDGVARGTESLARHTVGGLADSASLLMETFAKYMAVVTLDRRYAQKRDRRRSLRNRNETKVTLAGGVESGFSNLIQGFREGVTGVVRAPIRGAEKRGFEGFAKGLGKGLLGLLMKPIIGITDAAADVMIGVKSTVEYKEDQQQSLALLKNQLRPRRPMYGRDKVLQPYRLEDAAAATLMLRTRCAGENYLGHMDMNDRVALLSVKRLIILGPMGEEQLALKYRHVDKLEVRSIKQEDGSDGWGIVVILNTSRRNGSDVEVISCHSEQEAIALCSQIQRGVDLEVSDAVIPS